jgi:hypothetical protein
MPKTAIDHFNQDIARASALVTHVDSLPTATDLQLRSDILRSAWMFAVGALDAYFCDAYTDLVAATIISKSRQPSMALPDFFYEVKFPVRAILEPYDNNENWRWRMAARQMMERENILKLETIRSFFNKFFRKDRKFFHNLLADWIVKPNAKKRLFGISSIAFTGLASQEQSKAVHAAWDQMQERYRTIFQRRHDCIHNCDRPKVSPQPLKRSGTVLKVIQDIEFLVVHSDQHICAEFREFLFSCGCTTATIAQAGY